MQDGKVNQYIKVDNEKIKLKAPGFVNTKMTGLYAMISSYLSNPEFEYCAGGLKNALMKHCTNRRQSFGKVWNSLLDAGYLKRVRLPYDKNKFRDYYELLQLPDTDIPAVRNMTAGQGRAYLDNRSAFEIPKHNFTGISYNMLRDERLSLMSKGLFCTIQRLILIAAHTPGLVITKELLCRNIPEGATAFGNAWRQLKILGYLELTRIYDGDLKQFRYIYKLNGSPYDQTEKKPKVMTEKPTGRQLNHYTEDFAKHSAPVEQAPLMEDESRYYTEIERLEYNLHAGFETWLPPAYTLTDRNKLREEIKYQIQYDWLINTQNHDKALADTVVSILFETALMRLPPHRKGETAADAAERKRRLHKLDFEAVDFALSCYNDAIYNKQIKNKKSYLEKILCNAEENFRLEAAAGGVPPLSFANHVF